MDSQQSTPTASLAEWVIPLSRCPRGCLLKFRLARVQRSDREFLEAIGIEEGVVGQLRKFGCPCILQIGAKRIGISSSLAAHIDAQVALEPRSEAAKPAHLAEPGQAQAPSG